MAAALAAARDERLTHCWHQRMVWGTGSFILLLVGTYVLGALVLGVWQCCINLAEEDRQIAREKELARAAKLALKAKTGGKKGRRRL